MAHRSDRGESENKQLLFKQPEGAMSEFMVDGHCNGASTKAMAGADCHELTVLIDQSQSRTSNVGNQERISGRIQFRTPVGFQREARGVATQRCLDRNSGAHRQAGK